MSRRIIFMGTPEFAVPSLEALFQKKFDIRLVVTQPDRPAGRGQRLTPPPVKTTALELGLPVLQTESIRKDESAQKVFFETECDFLIVAAFGQILPKAVLDHPKIAPLNVHSSLLPKYRGAAPIARAIMEQETESGVTIQWMVEALDMGDILYQIPSPIHETDTCADLHDRLKVVGANALMGCLQQFESETLRRIPQDPRIGSYAPKIKKEEGFISFDGPGFELHRKIMALSPWPGAECILGGKRLKIYRSKFLARPPSGSPGSVMETSPTEGIVVACAEGCIALLEVQLENRNRMSAADFLRGQSVPIGLILGEQTV